MKTSIQEKAFQEPNYTLYPKLFSAVKNVENAVRLLAYDNMQLLQSNKHFNSTLSTLSFYPIQNKLEDTPPEHNFDLYMTISNHLNNFEQCISSLWNEKVLQEPIKEIYFLIHQAYIELDKADLQPFSVKITSENEAFEDYLRSQISWNYASGI